MAAVVRRQIIEAALSTVYGAPSVPDVVRFLVRQGAGRANQTYAAATRALLAAWPVQGPRAAVGRRLESILALDANGDASSDAPSAPSAPRTAANTGATTRSAPDASPPRAATAEGTLPVETDLALAAEPFTPAWLNRQNPDLTPALRDRLALRLVPAETGLARLAGLAEDERRELVGRLRPHDAFAAFDTLDLLAQAWRRTEPEVSTPAIVPPRLEDIAWTFLLRELFEEDRLFETAGFVARWFEALTAGAPPESVRARRTRLAAALGDAPKPIGSDAGTLDPAAALVAALDRTRVAALEQVQADADPASAAPIWPGAIPQAVPGESIYVANAGLVLAGPYIPMLFDRLGLTHEGGFVDEASAERAVHLLQFLVDGAEPAPEHELMLNKLVCGMNLAAPIGRDFEVTSLERETVEGLLTSVIQRWSIIGATSVAGLRESFLQRQGALREEDEGWRLVVEPRAFDMLIDQIPWGFRTLKLAWMPQVLHVEWR
jgi:hypothetical protein